MSFQDYMAEKAEESAVYIVTAVVWGKDKDQILSISPIIDDTYTYGRDSQDNIDETYRRGAYNWYDKDRSTVRNPQAADIRIAVSGAPVKRDGAQNFLLGRTTQGSKSKISQVSIFLHERP